MEVRKTARHFDECCSVVQHPLMPQIVLVLMEIQDKL